MPACNVEAGGRNSIIGTALQVLLAVHLLKEAIAAVLPDDGSYIKAVCIEYLIALHYRIFAR